MKLKIKVHVGSSRNEIKKIGEGFEVWIKKRAVNGRANEELIKLLKKHFKRPVEILSGLSSRNKIIRVEE